MIAFDHVKCRIAKRYWRIVFSPSVIYAVIWRPLTAVLVVTWIIQQVRQLARKVAGPHALPVKNSTTARIQSQCRISDHKISGTGKQMLPACVWEARANLINTLTAANCNDPPHHTCTQYGRRAFNIFAGFVFSDWLWSFYCSFIARMNVVNRNKQLNHNNHYVWSRWHKLWWYVWI